jgi:hypothetical protein
MPNSKYRAGRDLEYAAARDLEANGYQVIRAAGSHGLADLIGFKPGELVIVQCKTDGKMTATQRAKLSALADMVPASPPVVPLIARWESTGPRGGRTVAYARTWLLLPPEPWTPDHALEVAP